VKHEPPLVLDRTEAYTAILIDDLISKGTNEPYRMFTSRAEFRLHLRIDNADRRLTPHGRRVGLIKDDAWHAHLAKQQRMEELKVVLEKTRLRTSELPSALAEKFGNIDGSTIAQLLKRPESDVAHFVEIIRRVQPAFFERGDSEREFASDIHNELKAVETEIKYAGYLDQQTKAIDRLKRAEQRVIPEWFDYASVSGLSREMREKMQRVRPQTIGHASRIPGVTPAAVSLINVYIEIQGRKLQQSP
jgi:tRNA uridine 5-carboxymethylaminomethyl modification enzyme